MLAHRKERDGRVDAVGCLIYPAPVVVNVASPGGLRLVVQNSGPKQIKVRTAIEDPLETLDWGIEAFGHPLAPGLRQPCLHGVVIVLHPVGKADQFRNAARLRRADPGRECLALPMCQHRMKLMDERPGLTIDGRGVYEFTKDGGRLTWPGGVG